MPLFHAKNLFYIRNVGPDIGMPCWANLRVGLNRRRDVQAAALTGPGLYGVFFNGYLIYIGIYAGLDADPFGGSVLHRWSKHIVGQTLRARDLFFKPGPLQNIILNLNSSGSPAAGLANACPNGRKTSSTLCPPLKTRAILSGFNKAWFATKNWGVLGPGNEHQLLGHFTFKYQQIAAPDGARPHKSVVKSTWLKPLETKLIKQLEPICNRETDPKKACFSVSHKDS